MNRRHIILQLLVATSLFSIAQTSCFADEHSHRGREAYRPVPHQSWHGDIRHFHEYDMPRWRSGRWYHGLHDGQHAWWWIAGGVWYFYPRPVYPYPDPYLPPVVVVPQPGPTPLAPPQYWYYCQNPEGYYPYVTQCPTGWQKVPATIPPDIQR